MDAITLSKAAGVSIPRAQQWAAPLTAAMTRFDINTAARQADHIAQCAHETMGFACIREIWGPTPAQRGYEGRADLGNTQPGDGKRFLGRGTLQITGRDNYAAVSKALGVDLVKNPQLIETDFELAALVGAWFWKSRGLNGLTDQNDFLLQSIRINGKNKVTGLPNGWVDRQARRVTSRLALEVR